MSRKLFVQGQGPRTGWKEEGFAIGLEMSLDLSKAEKVNHFPYWHIDLNAGSGYNESVDCEGSPLVFQQMAEQARRKGPIDAYFCDRNEDAIRQLQMRMIPRSNRLSNFYPHFLVGDNALALPQVAAAIEAREPAHYAMGTVLSDANSYLQGFPLNALSDFLWRFPRMDFIFHFNTSLMRTGSRLREKGAKGWTKFPDLEKDWLPRFHRRYWMIRNPPPGGAAGIHFLTMIGRRKKLGDHSYCGFFPIHSHQGREILRGLKHIDEHQPNLFWGLDE